jgi:5'-nucleotidase
LLASLGNLIADAQRSVPGAQFAFMNPGGIRADLDAGEVTWGELFTIQPFGNDLVGLDLTGAQIKTLLEQQWLGQPSPRMLEISGLRYTWSASRPLGDRVVEIRSMQGQLLDPAATFRVSVNSSIAAGELGGRGRGTSAGAAPAPRERASSASRPSGRRRTR